MHLFAYLTAIKFEHFDMLRCQLFGKSMFSSVFIIICRLFYVNIS